jgi:hypothetical protein
MILYGVVTRILINFLIKEMVKGSRCRFFVASRISSREIRKEANLKQVIIFISRCENFFAKSGHMSGSTAHKSLTNLQGIVVKIC